MNNKQILLVCLMSSILAACGSTKSSSSSQQHQTKQHQKKSQKVTGVEGLIITEDQATQKLTLSETPSSSSLNQIVIKGKTITIVPQGIVSGGFTKANNYIASGTKYAHSKFGIVDEGVHAGMFSHGVSTKNMPASGTATYLGEAIGSNFINHYYVGKSKVDVDFAAKSIDVRLDSWTTEIGTRVMPILTYKANISGNKFFGANGEIQGRFYGDNAAEVGGIVNAPNAIATFGGIKQ